MELRPGIFFKENEIQIQGHGKESLQQTNSLPNSSEGETSSQHWQRHPLQEYYHHHEHHRHCHQNNHHHHIIIIIITSWREHHGTRWSNLNLRVLQESL